MRLKTFLCEPSKSSELSPKRVKLRSSISALLFFGSNVQVPKLAWLQQLEPADGKLIVVDGVFSMEGDIVPLPELCRLAQKYGAAVMVDDAHATGVLGKKGAGTASHFGLTDQVHLIMSSFSKSLASLGGFIASDAVTIDFLKHHSRPLIFSASMSPANAAAVLAALDIMQAEPERIARLWHNTARMKDGLLAQGFNLGESETPILPVYCRDLTTAFMLCKRLEQEGVFVNPIVSPAVPPGQEDRKSVV